MSPELGELARLGLEKAFNVALAADPAAQASVTALKGKRLRIQLKGLFSFDLLAQVEHLVVASPGIDTPDATLRASPLGFLRAKMHGDLMHGDLELLGDSHTSVRAARLLSSLKPDIEIALAPILGNLLAHQVGRVWHSMRFELTRLIEHHSLNKADFFHDEIDVSPRQAELEDLYDSLDPLQNRVAALEARINAIAVSYTHLTLPTKRIV